MLAYESDVTQFIDHLAAAKGCRRGELQPEHLDVAAIRSYLGHLHLRGLARSSTARKVAALRAFARFLRREGAIEGDPTAFADRIKLETKVPVHLGEDEVVRLLEMPDAATPLGRRDRAMLELFYASGLRLSELVGLNVDDANLSARMARVLGKGRKERLVPFNRSAEAGDPRLAPRPRGDPVGGPGRRERPRVGPRRAAARRGAEALPARPRSSRCS